MFKRVIIFVIGAMMVLQVGRQLFMVQERAARNYIYSQAKTLFPEAFTRADRFYGLFLYSPPKGGDQGWTGPDCDPEYGADARLKTIFSRPGTRSVGNRPVVVLVHGLDEPGRVWMNLAPVLYNDGYQVVFLAYPNDQCIADSARFFYRSLAALDKPYLRDMAIVAHSMGGLVSRQMLTSARINYAAAQAQGRVPRVRHLIMAGTPNHGSQLARFRLVMEIRDQAQALLYNDAPWLMGLQDGAGAAGLDLIPSSPFFSTLNSRPHPLGTRLHVIAGIASPWDSQDIRRGASTIQTALGIGRSAGIEGIVSGLTAVNETIGDGLVSLESAALDNIPLTRVHGTHLTMIRNLSRQSDRTPPAIPLILKILGGGD